MGDTYTKAHDWNVLGAKATEKDIFLKAIDCYMKVVEIEPDNKVMWNKVGDIYRLIKDYSKAVECYKKIDEHDKVIQIYEEISGPEKILARTKLESAYDAKLADAKEPYEICEVGNGYMSKGFYDKAIESFIVASKVDPNYKNAYESLGHVYFIKKDYDKVIESFKKILEIDPENASALNKCGTAYFYKSNYDEALSYYHKALKIEERDALIWMNRGNVYAAKEAYGKAAECYKEALKLGNLDHTNKRTVKGLLEFIKDYFI